jgi:hypothetical protein
MSFKVFSQGPQWFAICTLLCVIALPGQLSMAEREGRCQGDIGQVAQRGCCSSHKGVCGCSGGVVRCCGGSASPSCRCYQLAESFGPLRSPVE